MSRIGHRDSLEVRLKKQTTQTLKSGKPVGWQEEALNFYLDGESIGELCRCYEVGLSRMHTILAKQALYRLMRERGLSLVSEIQELEDGR